MALNEPGFGGAGPLPDPWGAVFTELSGVLEDRGRSSRALAVRRMSFRDWSCLVPEARGPLDFERFVFQRELYDEAMAHDREVVVQKGTQVGASTMSVRWALFHADVFGRVALYTFPTERELGDFSRQRIRPVIRSSPHLLERIPVDAVDNVGLRQVGNGWLAMRGTNKPIDSINADVVCFDEYDSSSMANVEASERRVTGPLSAGLLRRIGVPTVPGFGIGAAFDASDQRVWTVKCGACGQWNPMRGWESFVANVDQERLEIVCRKCRRRLEVQQAGEWVAAYPDRDVRGYHLPKLIVPGVRVAELVANSKKTRPDQREAFHQRDLGEPYAPAENRLSLEQIKACVDESLTPLASLRSTKLVTAGIDVASARALNVVIEEAVDERVGRRVFVGEIEDGPEGTAFEQLGALMDRYGVAVACIDHLPEGRFAQAFAAAFPGRVFRVGYYTPAPGSRGDVAPWKVDYEVAYVGLWRTKAIDATLERFRTGCVRLPRLDSLPTDYPVHLGALVRRVEETESGQMRVGYAKTGPDDYLHAEVYNLAAIELWWHNARLQHMRQLAATPQPLLGAADDDYDEYGIPVYRAGFEPDY